MIIEDYVSFETAKLLKEKGYCNMSTIFYKENGELIHYKVPLNNKGFSSTLGVFYEVPTFQMAMKWLREVHKLAIDIEFQIDCPTWKWRIYHIEPSEDKHTNFQHYDTYEQACEAAIKYCLENLI